MAFCKFSSELVLKNSTAIDNAFINDFMLFAPESAVKVYLYGLYKCQNADSYDNTIESFAKVLQLSPDDIESCFMYWKDQGLVTIIKTNPIEIRYLPVTTTNKNLKLIKKSKYDDFTKQVQELIEGRMLNPNEFDEYYSLMESLHIEPNAMIMIIKYCINLKGKNVGYSYILTVAKNWAYEGILTADAVEKKMAELELSLGDVKDVLKVLGIKRNAYVEENQLLVKWKKDFGFNLETILVIAKSLKKKGGMLKLDAKLTKYYELKLLDLKEIEEYEANKQTLFDTAKNITRAIGVYYENLENVIETYVTQWQNMGYSAQTLEKIAGYCFTHNIRTLEKMNQTILQFYNKGLITQESIETYFSDILKTDEVIKTLLKQLNLTRIVTSWDRDAYRTWTYSWNFSNEMIEYACSLAKGKIQPISYMNKVLSTFKQNNIFTLEQAKNFNYGFETEKTIKPKKDFALQRSYTPEQINALFDNLDEVKLRWLKMQL